MIEFSAARASGLVGSKPSGDALSGVDFHRLDLDAYLVEQIGKIGELEQHADRADQRGLLRHDVIAGERRECSRRTRPYCRPRSPMAVFSRSLVSESNKLLGTGGGAAGAVDMDDDGARRRRPCEPVELFDAIAVAADQS